MLEFLFVVGFFVMLMVTGISLIGVLGALVIAAVVMLVGGLIVTAIKVLPWLLLAVALLAAKTAARLPLMPCVVTAAANTASEHHNPQ
ncbi:envelope stress response protein PspG [Symbiopectobacterium purcellii]|uniref:Envelope stress response protein PspG n=1 Tax=Symbiopectobacterium purcellii TaxID=2871826 RepID=A0ABX9APU3_9ENTR|nr:envelope stress response protein PspG [Symbiopectobacterium purcellii]